MHRKFCTLALTGLFTLGIAAGALAQDQPQPQDQTAPSSGPGGYRHHGPPNSEAQLKHLTRQLDLSADQQTQIKPILDARQQQMQALWQDQSLSRDDRRQKAQAIQSDSNSKIEAVLNDTQKQKYEAWQAQMQQRRGGPPPSDSSSPQPQQ
jgi:periplasmic protein CpxP/Spy